MSDVIAIPPINETEVKHTPTVYFIDDSATMREVIKIAFRRESIHVITCADAASALAQFEEHPPDVVITDYAMGRMNGMDLIRECRRLNPRQKMILLSGTVDEHVFAEAPVKPDQFLTKPYQIHELAERIRSLLATIDEGKLAVMKTIKRALDPKGLMNPGKVFNP